MRGWVRRGRVLARATFDRHWGRWQEQRPALGTAYRSCVDTTPWREVHVVDRDTPPATLPTDPLGPYAKVGGTVWHDDAQ
jgi:hypothetical protein